MEEGQDINTSMTKTPAINGFCVRLKKISLKDNT